MLESDALHSSKKLGLPLPVQSNYGVTVPEHAFSVLDFDIMAG